MNFNSVEEIKALGFVGFKTKEELFLDSNCIPNEMGVYLILYLEEESPVFTEIGTGGHFKGKNPNILIDELKRNWVSNCKVIYIGKAGGFKNSATLKKRLNQYFRFGQGKPVGHWGGRLIWQLQKNRKLVVCWKSLKDKEPSDLESNLLKEFFTQYKALPFANLRN